MIRPHKTQLHTLLDNTPSLRSINLKWKCSLFLPALEQSECIRKMLLAKRHKFCSLQSSSGVIRIKFFLCVLLLTLLPVFTGNVSCTKKPSSEKNMRKNHRICIFCRATDRTPLMSTHLKLTKVNIYTKSKRKCSNKYVWSFTLCLVRFGFVPRVSACASTLGRRVGFSLLCEA